MSFNTVLKLLVDNLGERVKIDDFYLCKKDSHLNKNYKYYCLNCRQNLCSKCLQETNSHSEHNILYYPQLEKNIEEMAYRISHKIKRFNINKDLKDIFLLIYDYYLKNPINYSYIQIIKEFDRYLNEGKEQY